MANQNFNQENDQQLDSKVKNYVSPEGITTKQLEFGLWYVEHKRQLRLVLIGLLIAIAAVSWSYTIYGFSYYLARGMSEDEILSRQLVQSSSVGHDYVLKVSAQSLLISPVNAIKATDNKYDLYAMIRNDNQNWWAEFDYYFASGSLKTEKKSGYVMPLEDKNLMALAQDLSNGSADTALVMENISWHRVDLHKIPDWNAYRLNHLNITAADVKFTSAVLNPLSEKLNLNELNFTAVNQTAYNYWEVGFAVLLYRGGDLVGLNHYSLSDFMSGEKRAVSLSWPGSIGRVDKVDIIPEINIMKDDIYIPFEGGVGQPSGNN